MQGCGLSGNRWASFETPAEQTPLLSRGRSDIETQFATFTTWNAVEGNFSGPRFTQEKEERRLPKLVWLMLKIMCVFWQKRLIVRRKCFHCQMNPGRCLTKDNDACGRELPSYFDADGQGYEHAEAELETPTTTDRENVQCKMCDSYWWNSEGNVKRYTEKEIGVQWWNHSRSSLLSVCVLVSLLFINVCDISLYISFEHGKSKHSTIHILSYSIYLAELSFYPIMCLYSKLRTSTQGVVPRLSWSTALNARFIIKRMQFIDFRRKCLPGVVFLLISTTWPFFLVFFRISIYLYTCTKLGGLQPMRVISLVNTLTLMLIWSSAQYIMYLCRLSFQRQLQLVANYIKDNQTDIDFCRQLIWHVARDFNCYRRYVLVYMSISFPIFTWAATTVLCWQYAQGFMHDDKTCFSIVLLVWFQIVMFPTLSVLSSGGLDVSYMWEYFRIKVFTIRRERNSQYFWRKVCHHIEHVGIDSQRVSWTMVFSFISSFMAIYSSDAD